MLENLSDRQLLEELNRELDAVVDSSYDGIVVADGEGRLLRVGKSYERISGVPAEKILGRNMRDVVKEGYVSESVTLMVLEKGEAVTINQRFATGRESIITGSPFFDQEGRIFRVVTNVRDMTEINSLEQQLIASKNLLTRYMAELEQLRIQQQGALGEIVAVSKGMEGVLLSALKSSDSDATVLVSGESGVGKELIAQLIHNKGDRKEGPFIQVNCGAIPHQLLESELFGYEGGAFSGAKKEGKAGLIELADGGSLHLDEVSELPYGLQVKLLRFLQEKEIWRIGGTKPQKLDVRVIASTNRGLEELVQDGLFREDLYFRLNVIQINIPPLRKRRDDIIPLARYFLGKLNRRYGCDKSLTGEAYNYLMSLDWPGNVRELANLLERTIVTADREMIGLEQIKTIANPQPQGDRLQIKLTSSLTLEEAKEQLERELLAFAFNQCGTTRAAAKVLGVDHSTVVRKMSKYGIRGKTK